MSVIDDFMSQGIFMKVAFIVVLLANFCSWLSFTTTSWYVIDGGIGPDTHVGLWRSCTVGGTCGYLDGVADEKGNAVQAFAIFGFVSLNVANLLIVLFMFVSSCNCKGNKEAGMVAAILLFCSGVFWLIAVIVFGEEYGDRNGYDLEFSFGFAIVAAILAVVGGILALLGTREGSSVTSK